MLVNSEIKEAAERVYAYLTERKRYVSLKPEDIASICKIDQESIPEVLRFLENEGRISIWKMSKYLGCWDIKAIDTTTSTSCNEIPMFPTDSFVDTPTLGMGALGKQIEPLPRLHYLQATALVKDVFPHQDLAYQVDSCHCELEFGQKRRKITLSFNQNKPGLDYQQYSHALSKTFELIEQKLNRKVSKAGFTVTTLHLSMDFVNLRLENVSSVTLPELDGWLYRFYNKGDSLRSEMVLTNGRVTLDQLHFLMLSRYNEMMKQETILKVVSQLQNDIKELKENGKNSQHSSILVKLRSKFAFKIPF